MTLTDQIAVSYKKVPEFIYMFGWSFEQILLQSHSYHCNDAGRSFIFICEKKKRDCLKNVKPIAVDKKLIGEH